MASEAAEEGYAQAQLTLGMNYKLGRGVVRDEVEGVKWIRKAAEQNDGGAKVCSVLHMN